MATENKPDPVEPTLYLLFYGMIFFAGVLIGVEYFFKEDGQMFQVIAGILTGFTGAFFGRMKPGEKRGSSVDNSVNVQSSGNTTAEKPVE